MKSILIDSLLHPAVIVFVYLICGLIFVDKKQAGNAFTRFLMAIWFYHVWLVSYAFSVDEIRAISRWTVLLIGLGEILSYATYKLIIFTREWKRRRGTRDDTTVRL